MKNWLKYGFSVLLSILLLISSTGVPLYAHICHMSGDREVSIVPQSYACCDTHEDAHHKNSTAEQQEECRDANSCCAYQMTYLKADIPAMHVEKSQDLLKLALATPVLPALVHIPARDEIQTQPSGSIHDPLPARPSGRALLSLIQILRD